MDNIRDHLLGLQDLEYKEFQKKLMLTVDADTIIGVRTPALRAYAKELLSAVKAEPTGEVANMVNQFLEDLPHKYYDENNLHGFLIEGCKDFDRCVAMLTDFLPYVDNWATCDMMSPKVLKKYPDRELAMIKRYMASSETYTIRFGMEMLMRDFLDERFSPEYLEWVAVIRSEEYYVNMMIAWYFATALAKQYETTLPYIQDNRLDKWTHNKAIQKAIESYRITPQQKELLRGYKIK